MSGVDDPDERRRYQAPYSARNPIPTIARYREEKAARQQEALNNSTVDVSKTGDQSETAPNASATATSSSGAVPNEQVDASEESGQKHEELQEEAEMVKDTSEVDPAATDARLRRKNSKVWDKERAERLVTDPVTHLPITIHDFTEDALQEADVEGATPGLLRRIATKLSPRNSDEKLRLEQEHIQMGHDILANRFPPPSFDALRQELSYIYKKGITMGLAGTALVIFGAFVLETQFPKVDRELTLTGMAILLGVAAGAIGSLWALVEGVKDWVGRRVDAVFEDEVWEAQRKHIVQASTKYEKETTVWLNSLLGAMWPLVNPDLFASLGDTLEDVMQASLPKLVRMVSVDDIGQGSEAVRILGVRWLPAGAATESVTADGKITSDKSSEKSSKGSSVVKAEKAGEQTEQKDDQDEADEDLISPGLLAEEGEFINLEIAFAYRTRNQSKSFKAKSKDMHIYLAFFLPGNIKIPVWVDLHGIVGTMRLRLQLTPDPPFFELCTITFLGQPKVNLSCVPLSKHGLNIMDVPLISKFVQSAVDAAMAQYVAPKSLTLDLKDMLSGEDFKKDTHGRGVLVIHIKRGYDFKMGDSAIPLVKDASSDPYVSVGWAKFGKVVSSTRIMLSEMQPCWEETFFMLVTLAELNVEERLRVQLWDSDRFSADDDLGRIEVSLKEIMSNKESHGKMWDRTDGFKALKPGDEMPGKLEWSVGYFPKARIQQCQFDKQTVDTSVRSMEQLRVKVDESCERKLREAIFKERKTGRNEDELKQQKKQELKAQQDAMIISAPPPDGYPSGIFSLQIHNITGLEVEKLSKATSDKHLESDDEKEQGHEGLPSAYCTILINHHKVYRTRTKPQNSKPFYNAGCERFIRDWRDAEVFVSVRDSRMDEDDPLLGMVHLPLHEIFKERSQVMGTWPLAGGIGHGKVRLSVVWRSVQLQAPRNLLGWDFGTVEVKPLITGHDLPSELYGSKLKLRSNLSSGKMYASKNENSWQPKSEEESVLLAVNKRYSSCVSIAFKHNRVFGDDIVAFSVLWLKDVPDEEDQELELPVWKGDFKRACSNCLEAPGEKIGSLRVKLIYWAGLGMAHSAWANKDQNLRDIVEVINTAQENLDVDKIERKIGIVDAEMSSDSDSSDDEREIPDGSANDKQGPIDQIRDYKRREKALHRRHRGLMQWKIPRTAKWVKNKVEGLEKRVSGAFDRTTGQAGIETEV
ncbi:unnamed protein product [Clonostachys rosea]|uniref:C2 domain-containing protein n=1 Tax=Bionectria ochroleuca TaxID=29856 RepID=A0ABY6V195_BIOOC|nr:unnamed protein product [Clonostachys rosea]